MAAENDIDLSNLKSQLSQTHEEWKHDMERSQSQVDVLQTKIMEVKISIQGSEEDAKKELEVLWRRVKTTATLLTYLKSKAQLMAVPHLAHTSCGIKQLEGVGFIDKNGTPLSSWTRNIDLSSFDGPDEETLIGISGKHVSLDEQDATYTGEILKSVQMVTDVMEALVKRVILAESETVIEKEKVTFGQEEIKRKSIQIENMSLKLEEMERFALGTNSILNEMRQRVEDLVEETSRQRQRAAENEQELCRVKRDFESLKSYVSSLITVRETLLSSEKQFQTIEKLFERLVAKTTQLEGEKMQKETEVQKLMEENVRLSALLDKKEAQLLAMNEQCKGMAAENDIDLSNLKSQLSQTHEEWKHDMERSQSQVDVLQTKIMEVKISIQGSEEDAKKELEVLWRRVKTTATLLTYLKSKAQLMAVPHLAHTSCGIKQLEGVGFIDKNGTPLSSWTRNIDLSSFDGPDEETLIGISGKHVSLDEQDATYTGEILKSVQMVTDVMEALVKRVILAESETVIEKEKVTFGQEEIKRKSIQIENMSLKLEEMERFALGTNSILNEMRQRVEDLVEETSRQRQRAAENEQELCRVKRDFESLKSYVSSLITVRETLLSSEKQFQTIEKLFERLVAKTTQLEGEKMQKETEVQKLMEENVRLSALLDKKEAQLLAMNEQCKVMALSASNI
ncbi:hypothetical protein CFP56_038867 [Quercus suber]|uniref:Uncharacterized protein n=2 Tax=Quercus suber TaxID=58331 RepID=A0AAW0LNR5_QUESU